ncbi:MAG: C25 family cysteine peptidase [Candidatus Fermentibacteria bacterium]
MASAPEIAHEVMMLGEDVSSLVNGHRLPVSFWGTCDVGHFDSPGTDAISETLVYHPAGGCISSVAATRGTFGSANYQYFRSVIDSLCSHQDLTVGDAVWYSKLALSGSYSSNNKYYVLFGYPDMPLPLPDSDGSIILSDDTLRSGELNTISGTGFQNDGLAFIEVLESSSNFIYTCLGGAQVPYIRYGGTAYSGSQFVEAGEFTIDCFIPVQSTIGSMARAAAFALSSQFVVSGAEDPAILAQGTPEGSDLEGPAVNMWIRGYEGIAHPELTGDITLEAELTDSSGICLLGGSGRELNLFVDGNGNDVSSYFSYNRGSSVAGKLVYTLEAMSTGEHTLILLSVDGLGNSSMDTLNITILEESDLEITEALVYPNPGNGRRCFSFRISEDAQITVSIFTVAGTRIEDITQICSQGYNQILWNGLDHDGDPVASGPYIYKINAEALGTSVFSRTTEEFGILAVIRED